MEIQLLTQIDEDDLQQHQETQQTENRQLKEQSSLKRVGNFILNFKDILGEGSFSKVYRGYDAKDNKFQVAIKIIEKKTLTPQLKHLIDSEIKIIRLINHHNIVKCYEVLNDQNNIYIVMELCSEGDLETRLNRNGPISEIEAIPIIKGVFNGLLYLSELKIIHRDIKAANIFMHQNTPKIADFGFAIRSKEKKQFHDISVGSPIYMSPQGIKHNVYGPTTDVWAFGIFIYELLHGKTPYSHCTKQKQLKYNISNQIGWGNLRADLSYSIKEIIYKCLEVNYEKRITFQKLKELHMFRQFNSKKQSFIKISPDKKMQLLTPKSNKQKYFIQTPLFMKIQSQGKDKYQKMYIQNDGFFRKERQQLKTASRRKEQISSSKNRYNYGIQFWKGKNQKNFSNKLLKQMNSNSPSKKNYNQIKKLKTFSNKDDLANHQNNIHSSLQRGVKLFTTQIQGQDYYSTPFFKEKKQNTCRTQSQQFDEEDYSFAEKINKFDLIRNHDDDGIISFKYGHKTIKQDWISTHLEYSATRKFNQNDRVSLQKRNKVKHFIQPVNPVKIDNLDFPQENVSCYMYSIHFSRLLYKLSCNMKGKKALSQIKTQLSMFCLSLLKEMLKKIELHLQKKKYSQDSSLQPLVQIHQTIFNYLNQYESQFSIIGYSVCPLNIPSMNSNLQKQMKLILSSEIKSKEVHSQNVRILYLSWVYSNHFNNVFGKYFLNSSSKHWFKYNLTHFIKEIQSNIEASNTPMNLQTYLKVKKKQQQGFN